MSASKKAVTFQVGQDSPQPLPQLSEGPAGSIVTVTPEWAGIEKFSKPSPKFQNRSSPPFHPGGRGAKQLSKALEQCTEAEELSHSSPLFVMCYGRECPCYAKVIGHPDETQTLITPMKASPYDSALLVPMTGRLWLAKNANLHPVEVLHLSLRHPPMPTHATHLRPSPTPTTPHLLSLSCSLSLCTSSAQAGACGLAARRDSRGVQV